MVIIEIFSNMIIPIVIVYIILSGYFKGVNVYEAFVEGAKEGFYIVLDILPTLIGLMMAVGILRTSGTLDIICSSLKPFAEVIGFPVEALPITFMRLVSSSASTGILLDTFKTFGPDSFIGRFVSVMMSCTETVLYTMSLYFMSVGITKTRYTLAGALIANFAGVAASLWLCKILW